MENGLLLFIVLSINITRILQYKKTYWLNFILRCPGCIVLIH